MFAKKISRQMSTVSMKRSAQTISQSVAPKRQRKMKPIAQNVRFLDMLKERKNYAAIERHYGTKESSVRYLNEESTKF